MCGIGGIATLNGSRLPDKSQLHRMCDTIVHRGPDDEGIFVSGRVGLGMRRLSIIDLEGGQQPIFNENRSICAICNGEIYNFRELRRTLIDLGHEFRTRSDTEVIVHAYEEYGSDFPQHLNGMFAIAVYDSNKDRICLVRDHLGIKPLFYSIDNDYLIWGSEIKVLLASGLIDRKLDLDRLGQFMSWEYVPGQETLFQGIRKLGPGCMLVASLGQSRCKTSEYWDIPEDPPDQAMSDTDWEDVINAKLDECVRRQLISDVPLGAFLSGGVDSSLIVAAMGRAKTFSIGFEDPSYNELAYSHKVAAHLSVEHITRIIEPKVVDLFDHLMYFLDDPIGDFSIFPTYLVSRLAREHVTVALSGDGGDEIFGGYETYIADEKAQRYEMLPRTIRERLVEPVINRIRPQSSKKGLINKAKRFIEGYHYPPEMGHARWRLFVGDATRQELFTDAALESITTPIGHHITQLCDRAGRRSPLNRSLYVDVKSYLCDNILTKVDRASMAVSLETRVPFLDKELVELAFRMPDQLKVRNGKTKVLLKRVAARRIPNDCVYRPKEGFSIPIKNWLGGQFLPLMDDLLNRQRVSQAGIFDWTMISELKKQHLSGAANHSHILWGLIVFEAWRKKWLEG